MFQVLFPVYIAALVIGLGAPAHAKRVDPPFIKPIRAMGKIFRDIFENDEADAGYTVFVTAEDAGDRSTIWKTKLYSSVYDKNMETDVQDVRLRSLKLENKVLVATDEGGHVYKINPKNGELIPTEPVATANCPLVLKVGEFIGSKGRKTAELGNVYCFKTDKDEFTEKTPLEDVKKKLFCSQSAMMDPGQSERWYIHCDGVDLRVTGKPSAYKIVGLRVHPLPPVEE